MIDHASHPQLHPTLRHPHETRLLLIMLGESSGRHFLYCHRIITSVIEDEENQNDMTLRESLDDFVMLDPIAYYVSGSLPHPACASVKSATCLGSH